MSVIRVDYRERQRLTTPDLRAEQAYRLAAAGRHHLGPHDWGVVRGLQVTGTGAADVMLWPGVAVDGYGRAILVLEPVPIAVPDAEQCWLVLLYYCEDPAQVPPGRACQDQPAPRTRQRYAVTVVDAAREVPLPTSDLGAARIAGVGATLAPWPLTVARVGGGCPAGDDGTAAPFVDTRAARHVRHRAAVMRAPSGRAVVQLGLRHHEDLYQFLVSTRGAATPLERRIGIDRDRDVHVWRPLVLTGPTAGTRVALSASRVITLDTVMPAGIGRRLRVGGALSRAGRVSDAFVVDARAGATATALTGAIAGRSREGGQTLRFGTRTIHLDLATRPAPVLPEAAAPDVRAAAGSARRAAAPASSAFAVTLSPFDGRLRLAAPAVAAAAALPDRPACFDVERYRLDQSAAGPALQLRPGLALQARPTTRELHALTVSAPADLVPRTQLRLAGGADDPSDASARVTLGATTAAGDWLPAVQMAGNRGLQILGTDAREALRVEGAIYLPAIGRDDPLFPELMALAFMGGLKQGGSVMPGVTATVQQVTPSPLERGGTFAYDLRVTYANGTKPSGLVLKQCIEVVSGFTPGRGDLVFRTLAITLPATTGAVAIPVSPFQHRADAVDIRVALLLKNGTNTGVVVAASGRIAVS